MNPRLAFLAVAFALVAHPAAALEKRSVRLDDDTTAPWSSAATVTLRYYNICTGWLWAWGSWSSGEAIGVSFDPDCSLTALLRTSSVFTLQPVRCGWGWGYTGTIAIVSGDDCTGTQIAAQPWCPINGWTTHTWDVPVPSPFLLKITWEAPWVYTNPTLMTSDHPGRGPTGPTACGVCFPSNRVSHSEYYGAHGSYCPGVPFNDGTCDVEFVIDVRLSCPTGIEPTSWGKVKALYE